MARVEMSDVAENSQSTDGSGSGSGVSASVVLNTEAKSDVLESNTLRRSREFRSTTIDWEDRNRLSRLAARTRSEGSKRRSQSQSGRGKDEKGVGEHG